MMKFDSGNADREQIDCATVQMAQCLSPAIDQLLDLARVKFGAVAPLAVMRGGIAASLQPLLFLIFPTEEDRKKMLLTLHDTLDAAFLSAMEYRAEREGAQPEGVSVQ